MTDYGNPREIVSMLRDLRKSFSDLWPFSSCGKVMTWSFCRLSCDLTYNPYYFVSIEAFIFRKNTIYYTGRALILV